METIINSHGLEACDKANLLKQTRSFWSIAMLEIVLFCIYLYSTNGVHGTLQRIKHGVGEYYENLTI